MTGQPIGWPVVVSGVVSGTERIDARQVRCRAR
jgi:hypothetical protein